MVFYYWCSSPWINRVSTVVHMCLVIKLYIFNFKLWSWNNSFLFCMPRKLLHKKNNDQRSNILYPCNMFGLHLSTLKIAAYNLYKNALTWDVFEMPYYFTSCIMVCCGRSMHKLLQFLDYKSDVKDEWCVNKEIF